MSLICHAGSTIRFAFPTGSTGVPCGIRSFPVVELELGWLVQQQEHPRREPLVSGWSTSTRTAVAGRAGRGTAAAVAAAIDDVVSAGSESLRSLTSHTTIAVGKSTCQGGNDLWAAATIFTNLITNLIRGSSANSFISIIQSIDEGRHDFWIADAVISSAKLTESSTSLTSIASRLRLVDQASNITRIGVAASCSVEPQLGAQEVVAAQAEAGAAQAGSHAGAPQ